MSTERHPKWNEFVIACCESQSKADYLLRGHPELLEARTGHTGETPLHYLAVESCLEAVAFLVERGADVNTQDSCGHTPLLDAASLDHGDMVRFLLAHGADPNLQNRSGEAPLHCVARSARENSALIARLLLNAGADPALVEICRDTPADIAAAGGHKELAAILAITKAKTHGH